MSPAIGIALGGGAARGLAHLGVLEVLLGAGLRPQILTGTSFGALAGAAVAARGWDAAAARATAQGVIGYVRSDAFRHGKLAMFRRRKDLETAPMSIRDVVRRGPLSARSLPEATILPAHEVRAAVDAVVPDREISSLPCVFGAVAVDLATGEELLLDSGSLRVAVRASCAIPGLMDPVDVGGRMALDGGWATKVPAPPARHMGAGCVIAVDVSDELEDTADMTTGLNVAHRGDAIRSHRLKELQLRDADVVVRCRLGRFGWADFELAEEIIEEGRHAARTALARVLATVEGSASLRARAARFLHSCGRLMAGAEDARPVRWMAKE